MRCGLARYHLMQREAGALSAPQELALRRHVAGCPRCRAESVAERRLTDVLASLRTDYPCEIEIAESTLQRVAALGGLDRNPVPVVQLGWAALGALVWALLFLPALASHIVQLRAVLMTGWSLAAKLTGAAGQLASSLEGTLRIPLRLLQAMLDALAVFLSLGVVHRLVADGLALCFAVMCATIVVVVARDLRFPSAREGRA